MPQPLRDNSRAFSTRRILILLAAVYFLVRLPNLESLPLFTDEATYLRWAQLVAKNFQQNALVSMHDAKLPLHYWLLAATRWLNTDPLLAGRTLSVLLGALTLWPLLALCDELLRLSATPPAKSTALAFRLLAGAAYIFSPLLSFYQRMALAEPLLILEMVLMAWLSLRTARLLLRESDPRRAIRLVISIALVWGAALITKQNFSYLLGAVPLIAFAQHAKTGGRDYVRRCTAYYLFAAIFAAAIFVPILLGDKTYNLSTRLFYKPVFTGGDSARWSLFWQNLVHLLSPRADGHPQWWPHDPAHPLSDGLLYLFLTPPVLLLALVAPLLLFAKPATRRPALFMTGLAFLLLLPLLAGGNVLFSRFLCMATVALLLPVALLLAEFITRSSPAPTDTKGLLFRSAKILLAAAALLWPALATVAQTRDARAPTLSEADRYEFLRGPSSGTAAQHAIAYLQEQAAVHPLIVITGPGLSLNDDAAWVYLAGDPRIRLYAADHPLNLTPVAGQPDTYWLYTQQWLPASRQPVTLDGSTPILALSNAIPASFISPTTLPAATTQAASPDEPAIAAMFFNPSRPGDSRNGVVVYTLLLAKPPIRGP